MVSLRNLLFSLFIHTITGTVRENNVAYIDPLRLNSLQRADINNTVLFHDYAKHTFFDIILQSLGGDLVL